MKKLILIFFIIPNILFASSMKMIGEIGKLSEVNRTIEIKMYDNYFEPSRINIKKGDRVSAYLPNIIQTVESFVATSAIGAIWSSCSPDFGTKGVIDRFCQIKPKVLITCDHYFYNGKKINIGIFRINCK